MLLNVYDRSWQRGIISGPMSGTTSRIKPSNHGFPNDRMANKHDLKNIAMEEQF
eukprot:jgi/Botrbrau1/17285/Bobra.0015s0042.1